MKSYQEAQERLGKRDSKKLENNTYLVRREGEALAVRLHDTDVVTYFPDGRIQLNSGGWRTPTTKDRINKFAPVNLWQEKGQWFIGPSWDRSVIEAIYDDNMVILPDGSFQGCQTKAQAAAEEKLRAKVRKYAKDYVTALRAGKIGVPSNGDCWGCIMKDVKTGKAVLGSDHLLSHLKEKYYVPSLAWNALETLGGSIAAKSTLAACQGIEGGQKWPGDFIYEQIEKAIKRFIYRELGLAY